MRVVSRITEGALKKGESYPLVGSRNGRYLIILDGWKVSYPVNNFEPIKRK